MDKFKKTARMLSKYGVVTVPVFSSENGRKKWEQLIWEAMDDFPEYKRKGRDIQRVLGGFGALGNPASFHHKAIQKLRYKIKNRITKLLFRQYAQNEQMSDRVCLEMLFDRLCVRARAFGAVSKESWHRDIYDGPKYGLRPLPETLDGSSDEIFGGWVNLSPHAQHFVGILGSHKGEDAQKAQQKGGGFAVLSEADVKAHRIQERLAAQANKKIGVVHTNATGSIVVPAGHMVIFFQRILHAVAGGQQPIEPQLRLFIGHRLTEETTPLFPLDRIIDNNAVPHIPSGQIPPMYSKNHYAFFSTSAKYRTWAETTFHAQCLYWRQTPAGIPYATPGSADNRNRNANLQRYMPGLSDMKFTPYVYLDKSRRTMMPEQLSKNLT